MTITRGWTIISLLVDQCLQIQRPFKLVTKVYKICSNSSCAHRVHYLHDDNMVVGMLTSSGNKWYCHHGMKDGVVGSKRTNTPERKYVPRVSDSKTGWQVQDVVGTYPLLLSKCHTKFYWHSIQTFVICHQNGQMYHQTSSVLRPWNF